MPERKLMTGNEAVARGAWEAGISVATSYPGTPATEILEYLAQYPEVNAEWSVNEKVALEVAIGSSFAGARSIVSMKQVGVNVAADPLFSVAYTGVNGGLVIVTADEPGIHSSQNEQDNRYYAKFAQIPMLEPSDAQEAKDMTTLAFEISEKHDIPCFVRLTTRICHTHCVVKLGERKEIPQRPYEKRNDKYTMLPSHALQRHFDLEKRQTLLEAFSNTFEGNRVEMRSLQFGVVTSGISYQNVCEALPDFSVLKIGMTYPVPHQIIRNFASQVNYLYVAEENRPFLEEEILALGIHVEGKQQLLRVGELTAEALRRRILHKSAGQKPPAEDVPERPLQFCAGCGHRGIFHILAKHKLIVNGDIGCYSLGAMLPYNAMDTIVCMGASIGMDHGFRKISDKDGTVAVIGDSTFIHSGLTSLVNVVCNLGASTIIVLDNRVTAMTGQQPSPTGNQRLTGDIASVLDLAAVARVLGVRNVYECDAYDVAGFEKALLESVSQNDCSVIIVHEQCVMVERKPIGLPHKVTDECSVCRTCFRLGCPAINIEDERVVILDYLCYGCGICAKICPKEAITVREEP